MRILIASNELLWNATRSGKFREDLYHRFNEFSIEIPHCANAGMISCYLPLIFSIPPMKNLEKM
ncbi:MAG: sigma 54-interacting transcriptional regulator [Puia sp.]